METALATIQPIDLAHFDKKQLRAWVKEQDKARLAELTKTLILHPVVGLVAAFVAIDYLEKKTWGDSSNTMLGPVAANVIRAGLIAGPVMDALGKMAEIAGSVAAMKALGRGAS